MKRKLTVFLLLALTLGILCGCGAPPTATEAPAPASAEASAPAETGEEPAPLSAQPHDWAEPNAVDDSFSFDFEWRVTCGCDGAYEHFIKEELPAYVDRWTEGGEILATHFIGFNHMTFGWVCFTGTPRTELGWHTTEYQGRECFCRGFTVREEEEHRYTVAKSFAMEPVEMLKAFEQSEDGELLERERKLPALERAELYVPQLGQSFVLTDPEALGSLQATFSDPDIAVEVIREMPADFQEQSGFLPLYLHYTDGSASLVMAAGDGADVCAVWGDPVSVFGAESLFDRFGVPLPSPGYTHNADGTTTQERVYEGVDTGPGLHFTRRHLYTFDARGYLIQHDYSYHREDDIFDESSRETYGYRPDGKIETIDKQWESAQSGSHHEKSTYTYNELGQLTRYTLDDQDDPTRGMFYEYRYDEQNRLEAVIYHYRDGREGLPSGNVYYWYDGAGRRHVYGMDQYGNLIGGPEEDAGDHPIRR